MTPRYFYQGADATCCQNGGTAGVMVEPRQRTSASFINWSQ